MHGLKTSFQTFTKLSRKPLARHSQPISVRQNILIRNNMHKCLACGGIPRITTDGNVTGFQPKHKPYNHADGCSQSGRF